MNRNLTLSLFVTALLALWAQAGAAEAPGAPAGADSGETGTAVGPLQLSLYPPVQLVDQGRDVWGLRLNGWYARNREFTGLDLGICSRAARLSGIQAQLVACGHCDAPMRTVTGLQLGGVECVVDGTMGGVQFGGVYAGAGEVKGLQVGGLCDTGGALRRAAVGEGRLAGLQVGGWCGATEARGAQIGAVCRTGNLTGAQVGGILDTNAMTGAQVGVACVAGEGPAGLEGHREPVRGVQAGLVTQARQLDGVQAGALCGATRLTGLQVGAVALADELTGLQVGLVCESAGLVGLQVAPACALGDSTGTARGVLLAGGVNWCGDLDWGLQVAGLNVARNVRGIQIGLANYCDSLRGLQIGLVNISRDHDVPFIPFLNVRFGR